MPSHICIDTQLRGSQLRVILWLSVVLSLGALMSLMPLVLSYRMALLVLLCVCLWFAQISHPHLLAISTLIDKKPQDRGKFNFLKWQLQIAQGYFRVPWGQTTDIYQAKLTKLSDFGKLLILDFEIVEPFTKKLRVAIWHDQVDAKTWRQLKTLGV